MGQDQKSGKQLFGKFESFEFKTMNECQIHLQNLNCNHGPQMTLNYYGTQN